MNANLLWPVKKNLQCRDYFLHAQIFSCKANLHSFTHFNVWNIIQKNKNKYIKICISSAFILRHWQSWYLRAKIGLWGQNSALVHPLFLPSWLPLAGLHAEMGWFWWPPTSGWAAASPAPPPPRRHRPQTCPRTGASDRRKTEGGKFQGADRCCVKTSCSQMWMSFYFFKFELMWLQTSDAMQNQKLSFKEE